MADRLWQFNPGCATEPCCDEENPTDPCCTGSMPSTLYITDNFGEVELIYNGPRPVSLGTASDMWWGCATRSVTNGRAKALSGDCESTPINFETEIVFGLWCKGPTEGFRLYIFHDGCGSYDDGISVQTHQRESLGCTTAWLGQYNQIVAGSINGIPASDCNPFVWGPHSQSFPSTPYPYHALREIYGDSGTWTITE
jgi:hypothetical protein